MKNKKKEEINVENKKNHLPAVAVGVVAAEPGLRPSKLAKWASRASNKLLGA